MEGPEVSVGNVWSQVLLEALVSRNSDLHQRVMGQTDPPDHAGYVGFVSRWLVGELLGDPVLSVSLGGLEVLLADPPEAFVVPMRSRAPSMSMGDMVEWLVGGAEGDDRFVGSLSGVYFHIASVMLIGQAFPSLWERWRGVAFANSLWTVGEGWPACGCVSGVESSSGSGCVGAAVEMNRVADLLRDGVDPLEIERFLFDTDL